MGKLEKTLEKVEPGREDTKPLAERPVYQGLRLIEDKVYATGTSIKYWM